MVKDEAALRAAMRDWLAACEAVDTAMTAGEYADSVGLAETASLVRLRLHRELIALGWTPPQQQARQP